MSKFTEFLLALETDIGNFEFYAYVALAIVIGAVFLIMVV